MLVFLDRLLLDRLLLENTRASKKSVHRRSPGDGERTKSVIRKQKSSALALATPQSPSRPVSQEQWSRQQKGFGRERDTQGETGPITAYRTWLEGCHACPSWMKSQDGGHAWP